MRKLSLISDLPLTGDPQIDLHNDGFNFVTYAKVLAGAAANTPGPFNIGVFGDWGSGKTSLLKLTHKHMKEEHGYICVWFNAWRYEKEDHPIVPLISTVTHELKRSEKSLLNDTLTTLLNVLASIAYGFSIKGKANIIGSGIDVSFDGKKIIDRYDQCLKDKVLDESIYFNAYEKLNDITNKHIFKIAIFIDDLDRCLPDSAIKLLESIKVIFAQHGFVFFIGVSKRIIEGYLNYTFNEKYGLKKFDSSSYLDKIIQLPFYIPPHIYKLEKFTSCLLKYFEDKDREVFKEMIELISYAKNNNPRAIIRFINNLLIDREVSKQLAFEEGTSLQVPIEYFAVTRVLQQIWWNFFIMLAFNNEFCKIISLCSTHVELINRFNDSSKYPQLVDLIEIISDDPKLQSLIYKNKIIRKWLRDQDERTAAIEFLRNERGDSELEKENVVLFFESDGEYIDNVLRKTLSESEISFEFQKLGDLSYKGLNYFKRILICLTVQSVRDEQMLGKLNQLLKDLDQKSIQIFLGFLEDGLSIKALPKFLRGYNYFLFSKGVDVVKIRQNFK